MKEELLDLLYHMYLLGADLRVLYEIVERQGCPAEDLRPSGALEDNDALTQEALRRWMREYGVQVAEVPIIRALLSYVVELSAELERTIYREKEGIIAAGGKNFQWLLDRLAGKYDTSDGLADYLQVELFTQLPEILKRAKRIGPLVVGDEVPEGLRRRYRECVRSYLFRNPIACCALCRAVVEMALKETWERRFPEKLNPDRFTFGELIDSLAKLRILPDDIVQLCREVKEHGDKAVHGDAILQSDHAYRLLAATQQVLRLLFAHPAD